jgi:hypothetical protein
MDSWFFLPFPRAVLDLWNRRSGRGENLAGKVLRLIQDRLSDAEFGKNSPTRQDNSPQARIGAVTAEMQAIGDSPERFKAFVRAVEAQFSAAPVGIFLPESPLVSIP